MYQHIILPENDVLYADLEVYKAKYLEETYCMKSYQFETHVDLKWNENK